MSGVAPQWLALLRGINVGGNKKVPMAMLRGLSEGLGWTAVQSYIQSGNLVFRAKGKPATLAAALEQAIVAEFGFEVPVVVCSAAAWTGFAAGSPFADAAAERPNLLHLALAKVQVSAAAAKGLLPYCKAGERVEVRDGALWIDFVAGVARSKLTPAVLDRMVGGTVTARNWRSVQALAALLAEGNG